MLMLSVQLFSQLPDTTRKQLQEPGPEIDSLQRQMLRLEAELQELRRQVADGTDMERLLSIFEDEDLESGSFDNRSRRKQVDALLEAITNRPGRLVFNGNVTAIAQVANQNDDTKSFATGSFDIFAATSFGKGTLLFIDLEAIGGDGPDQAFPTFSGLNGDAGNYQSEDGIDRVNVLEAWGEFNLFQEAVTITAGKIDLTNYFDNNASANDETMQFISGSFINSSAFAVPSNSPGVTLRTKFFDRYHFKFGLVSYDNAGGDIFTDLYKIASVGWTFAPGSDFEANIRVYGYELPGADDTYGYGASFDKVIFGAYSLFGRYGRNLDSVAGHWPLRSAWSAGTRFEKTIAEKVFSIGAAYGENMPYEAGLETEQLIEVFIRRQVNTWAHLSPHFQYVWNAAGTREKIIAGGLRVQFNF